MTCLAEAHQRQASISSNGGLKVSDGIVRTAAAPGGLAVTENTRVKSISRHLENWPATTAASHNAERNTSFLAVGSSSNLHILPWLGKSQPTAPPTEYLLFNYDAGGRWDGEANDMEGEVGFEFIPEKDFNITAVARHVAGHYTQRDEGGLNLYQTTNVTIWWVLPKGMKLKKGWGLNDLQLVSVYVGPDDKAEVGGKYRFKYLDKPLPIKAHQRYR